MEALTHLRNSMDVLKRTLDDAAVVAATASLVALLSATFQAKRRVIFIGNGGSAVDAAHIAAEFEGQYKMKRPSLPALALTCNTATITAIGNDFGYDQVFARPLSAHGQKGDVLIVLTTSGMSENVIAAMRVAKHLEMLCVSFTGETGGKAAPLADIAFRIPSRDTALIQQAYMAILHGVCGEVEQQLSFDTKPAT